LFGRFAKDGTCSGASKHDGGRRTPCAVIIILDDDAIAFSKSKSETQSPKQ
jgi:uncharacterized protein (DUF2237 family)